MDTTMQDHSDAAECLLGKLRSLGYGVADELAHGFLGLTLVDVVTSPFAHAAAGVAVGLREIGDRLEIMLFRSTRAGWVRSPTSETARPSGLKDALLRVVGAYYEAIAALAAQKVSSRAA